MALGGHGALRGVHVRFLFGQQQQALVSWMSTDLFLVGEWGKLKSFHSTRTKGFTNTKMNVLGMQTVYDYLPCFI